MSDKTRQRLPNRRRSWTQKVRIADANGAAQTFYLTCGEYPDGRLGEIWIEAHKEGTLTRGVFGALARMASISLQCGANVAEVVNAMRHLDFPPNGTVEGSPAVARCSSIPDWIAQELAAAYLSPTTPEKVARAGQEGNEGRVET